MKEDMILIYVIGSVIAISILVGMGLLLEIVGYFVIIVNFIIVVIIYVRREIQKELEKNRR